MTTLSKTQYLVSLDAEKTILLLRSRRLPKKKATSQARPKRSNPCHYGLLSKNVLRMGTSSQWSYLGRMLVNEPLSLKRKELKMAEASKSVAEKKATNVVAFDFATLKQDVGKGNENVGKEDLALPFLKILSGVDPMLDKLEDARKGDIYNSVTEASYSGKEGIVIVPVAYQREFLRWAPRGQGSGAPTVYKTRAECPDVKRSEDDNKEYCTDGSGDYIEETHQHFVLVIGAEGKGETALIPMKSTQLKKSRKFNSMIMAQSEKDRFARLAYKSSENTLSECKERGS